MRSSELAIQFEDLSQQTEAATLGIWVFLATEVLFFGGLFLSYVVYRATYPEAVALAAHELDITIGTVNTALLLTSSFFMALAVESARNGRRLALVGVLFATEVLGLGFLVLKGFEYAEDIRKHLVPGASVAIPGPWAREARIFYFIYYAMTGLHALHLTIGLGLIGSLWLKHFRRKDPITHYTPVEVIGLYWHFVDVVWIFLYPLLYLVDRHS